MLINNLFLKNYRNYDTLNLEFNDSLNIFIGDNAQGKTNILEAIYILAVTKSFLGVNDKELIKFNNLAAVIESKVIINNDINYLKIKISSNDKKVYINDNEIKKLRDYISCFNVIIFTSDNIRMMKDGPNIRRKFLNIEISQLSKKYVKNMNEFNYILKQRNEMLKNDNLNEIFFDIITNKFIELSINIVKERKLFIDKLNNYIENVFKNISGLNGLRIVYKSDILENFDINDFKNKLIDSFERERRYGNTIFGPHRDDFDFFIDDKDLSLYGSQGQMRMAVLSLKISEIYVFKEFKGEYPLLLLDDIFSELDIEKRNNLIKYISNDIQTIITTTDLNMIDDKLINNAKIFKIQNGKIINESEE